MRFKDLSEVHTLSVRLGEPELFDRVVKGAIDRALHELSYTSPPLGSVNVDDSLLSRTFGAHRFVSLGEPKPRKYLIRGFALSGHPTYLYGAAATCKSLVGAAAGISIASPSVSRFLGFEVEEHGPVVIFDSELDVDETNRRVRQLCCGQGIEVPEEIYYVNAVGVPPSESFPNLLDLARFVDAIAVVIDSAGFAMRGDPESYRDVSENLQNYIDPLKASGITPLIVDHKPHQGDNLFGSVAKTYHGRFIFKFEDMDGEDRVKGERNVRLWNKKASFSDEGRKIGIKVTFDSDAIRLETNNACDDTGETQDQLDAEGKVKKALADGDKTKTEIAEHTGYTERYMANLLPTLVNKRVIHFVGKKGRAYIYGLNLSHDDGELSSTFTLPKGGDVYDSSSKTPLTTVEALFNTVIPAIEATDTVALDLETTGLDPRSDSIRLLSLATKTATYLVDCQSVDPAELFPILAGKTVVAHNALFDLGFLSSLGFEPGKVADTMILSQLLHAGSKVEPLKRGQTSHSLDSVVKRELGLEVDKTHQSSDWSGPLSVEMIEYAAKDVEVLLPLYEVLKAKLEEASLTYVAEIEHRALPTVVWMSIAGVPIDADGWREHAQRTEVEKARLEDELKALAPKHSDGKAWNFGSHQQVRKAAKLLGVDLPNTRDETLALYAKKHEFIDALRNYRKAAKLVSTYGASWLENGYHRDGRIYASWRQLRAATGRMACDHPNLQNIPRSGPLRSYIRAPVGRVFVIADYSQIELRIAAKISGDQEMLSAYAEGRDLHTLTARSLTGREEISKDDRKLAKVVNFGLLYGMGASGLRSYALKSYGIEMGLEEAALYRRRFFEAYPGLKRWHDRERQAWFRSETETRTLTGRRRKNVERLTDRLNSPVQGTGADGLKLALALLWERRDERPGTVPVIVCHDEMVVECDAEQAEDVRTWLESSMVEGMDAVLNNVGEEQVPVTVESRVASFWGEG